MKKVFILAAFVLVAVHSVAQVRFAVSGTYAKNGKTVYLLDQLTEKAIDSTVVADGKFSFTGSADKDALLAVKAKKKNWTTQFFNDGTPVIINLNDSTLKGSPQNERLTRINYEMEQPRKRFAAKTANLTEAEIEARADELSDEMNKMITALTTRANRAFNEERNSLIPVAFAGYYFLENGVEAYDELVKQQVAFAGHPYLKKMRDEVEEETKPKDGEKMAFIGQQYTDLEMADPDGKMHKISDLVGEGKYVLVDFWASWCGPCRAEMPNVLEAYNRFHNKGFEVVGVSFDQKKGPWVKAIGQLKMPWLQISDLKGWQCAAVPVYKIDGIPDNILIDPQGKIIDRGLRGKALHTKLENLLNK
ncbi:MAG: AhpC/TSA family protein [Prevotella sp.]|nr:AhpC/TSA family protein [Prevotella sp.]